MTTQLAIILFITGSIFGSFFYTLALRLTDDSFRGRIGDLLLGRSKCPSCGGVLSPFDLIPLIGYLAALGKCRRCKARISMQYPAAEIVSGLLLYLVCLANGLSAVSLCEYMVIICVLSASVSDIRSMKIPDVFPLLIIIFSAYPLFMGGTWQSPLYGLLLAGGFFLITALIFPGGFGGGDLKLSSAIGLFLGIELCVVALEASLLIGTVFGVSYALISGKGLRIKIPFAPFLAAGLIVSYFFGRKILLYYYGQF